MPGWDIDRWLCLMKYLRGLIHPERLVQEDIVMDPHEAMAPFPSSGNFLSPFEA